MRIRPAHVADAAAIVDIWNHMIENSLNTFTTILKTKDGIERAILAENIDNSGFFVADIEGVIVGFACYNQFRNGPGYAYTVEHSICIAHDTKTRGIGRGLMSAIEDDARQKGLHSMMAGVSSANPGAVAFHRKLGYAEIATLREVGRKAGQWLDLVLLQKFL